IDIFRFRASAAGSRSRFWNDMILRPGAKPLFQGIPPGEFRPRPAQFNKKERSADARPDYDQVAPRVVGEKLKRVNTGQNKRDPFRHDPEKQLDAGIDSGESNEDPKVQRRRPGNGRTLPKTPDREQRRRRDQ